jgi:FkbM family methyltransferase
MAGSIKIRGKTFSVSKSEELYLAEEFMTNILAKLVKEDSGAFIDVGVNIGQTMLKVKSIHPEMCYIGFEPNPYAVYFSKELISLNNLDNCEVIPVGLYDKNMLTVLFEKRKGGGDSSLIEGFRNAGYYSSKQFVPVFKGDYILDKLNISSISMIKIDVEGSELEVIGGLKKSIKKFKPFIICEVLPSKNKKNSREKRNKKLQKVLKSLGYGICRISFNETVIETNELDSPSVDMSNYIFFPIEHRDLLKTTLW